MTTADSPVRVLVFAKAPRPGAVKTRLVPLLGEDGAAAVQAELIEHTLETVREAAVGPIELHAAPATDEFLTRRAAHFGAELIEQAAGDLGERMHAALKRALRTTDRALLIGCDCPAMTADYLRQAAAALTRGDEAVLGPVEDGGYALIGLSRAEPSLFTEMPWSTAAVMATTRRRLTALRWQWTELETLWDLDRPADYERLLRMQIPSGRRVMSR